jgi:hypothetical protein
MAVWFLPWHMLRGTFDGGMTEPALALAFVCGA